MKKFYLLLTVVALIFAGTACNNDLLQQDDSMSVKSSESLAIINVNGEDIEVCGTQTYTLWAGQTINAGTLVVSNDETNLYVTYNTTGTFNTLHLWVGTDLSLVPSNPQGIPVPGQFPYTYNVNGGTSYTFTIPLASIPSFSKCGDLIYIVAHAEVIINGKNETAFGGDIPVNINEPGRWYYYVKYTTVCCETPPPPQFEKLGTAFAKGGYVFTTDKKSNPENLPSLNLTKNRWGWAINLKTEGTFSFELWNGAGLNYTSKGLLVGNVVVDFYGSQVTVTYNLLQDYSIEEAHIYAGDLKPQTIAPGQYGFTKYFNPYVNTFSQTFEVSDLDSDGIWLIAHAIVYGPRVVNI